MKPVPLPIDHHGLPESYTPEDLTPARWPTLKDWGIATAGALTVAVFLSIVFTMIDLMPLSLNLLNMVNAADGGQVCRTDTINGVRVEHCIRTVARY